VFAVAVTLALPAASVVAVAALRVAAAPVAGTANVTVAPETGLPSLSFTIATSDAPNAVATTVVCELPAETTTEAAVPASFKSANDAEADTPVTDAVTPYEPSVAFAVAVTLA
jgi:hypothetical protein